MVQVQVYLSENIKINTCLLHQGKIGSLTVEQTDSPLQQMQNYSLSKEQTMFTNYPLNKKARTSGMKEEDIYKTIIHSYCHSVFLSRT